MKRIILILFVGLGLFSSCETWLDIKPENQQTADEFWQKKEEVEAVMGSAYSQFRNCLQTLMIWGELRGDVLSLGTSASKDMLLVKELDIRPDNSLVKYDNIYKVISRCNSVIKFASKVSEVDVTYVKPLMNAHIAEAYWLRSLCYFYLVRTFNNVPFVTEPYQDDSNAFEIPTSTGDSILQVVYKELMAHKAMIPPSYTELWETKGRATEGSYNALLAEIALWQGKYDNVIKHCNDLDAQLLYDTVARDDWYTIYYPGNSDEGIFELQWEKEQSNQLFKWTFFTSTPALFSLSDEAREIMEEHEEIEKEADIRSLGGSYTDINCLWKYCGEGLEAKDKATGALKRTKHFDANWIIYRYADMILMKAEALIMKGDYPAAMLEIEKLRDRAGFKIDLLAEETEQQMLELLFNERIRELAGEGKRWFDLLRYASRNDFAYHSILIDKLLLGVSPAYQELWRNKLKDINSLYLPIHKDEIEFSNGVIKQNPFYAHFKY